MNDGAYFIQRYFCSIKTRFETNTRDQSHRVGTWSSARRALFPPVRNPVLGRIFSPPLLPLSHTKHRRIFCDKSQLSDKDRNEILLKLQIRDTRRVCTCVSNKAVSQGPGHRKCIIVVSVSRICRRPSRESGTPETSLVRGFFPVDDGQKTDKRVIQPFARLSLPWSPGALQFSRTDGDERVPVPSEFSSYPSGNRVNGRRTVFSRLDGYVSSTLFYSSSLVFVEVDLLRTCGQ